HLVEDHRGKTVYDVASGDALFISELGSLPENVTWLSPEGEFQKWNGTAWVKDAEAEKLFRIREAEETKNSLMQVASEHIAPLQDAVDLEIATEEETSLLEAWKKYRVLLNRVDTSTAPDIEWPGRTRHNVSEKEKPQTRRMQDVLRLAGELSIVRVLNDFQPLPILRVN
ncbi:caudovirales tail fiber assembly family protein, partial [Escherichia coli 08BKT055439]